MHKEVLILLIACFLTIEVTGDCLKQCCQTLTSRPKQTYTYYQNTGQFIGGSGSWAINTIGYSGQGSGQNNPSMQCIVNTGPLPANTYVLDYCKDTMHETVIRPCSFYLNPQDQSKMCGRSAFFIHGCDCCTNGDFTQPPTAGCSAGCIVISQPNRIKLRVGDILIVKQYENMSESFHEEVEIVQENIKMD